MQIFIDLEVLAGWIGGAGMLALVALAIWRMRPRRSEGSQERLDRLEGHIADLWDRLGDRHDG